MNGGPECRPARRSLSVGITRCVNRRMCYTYWPAPHQRKTRNTAKSAVRLRDDNETVNLARETQLRNNQTRLLQMKQELLFEVKRIFTPVRLPTKTAFLMKKKMLQKAIFIVVSIGLWPQLIISTYYRSSCTCAHKDSSLVFPCLLVSPHSTIGFCTLRSILHYLIDSDVVADVTNVVFLI